MSKRINGLPEGLRVLRFVRDEHFYVVAGIPGDQMHFGIWGTIGSLRPSAYRGRDGIERAIERLRQEGYLPGTPVDELNPARAIGARNLVKIATRLSWSDGKTIEVDLESAAPQPSAPAVLGATSSYDRETLTDLIRWVGETFTSRVKKNQSGRDRTESQPTLSRYINPSVLEEVRPISRSTDSSWGNVIGELATKMTQLRYGAAAPSVHRGRYIEKDERLPEPKRKGKQYIAHRVDMTALEAEIARVYNKEHGLDHVAFERLRANPPRSRGPIVLADVDLLYRDDNGKLRVFEMKASGQLDVKNGPANARSVLIRAILAGADAEPHYSSIQRESSGATTERDLPDHAVGAAEFWTALLPRGMGYAEFERLLETTLAPYKTELEDWLERRTA